MNWNAILILTIAILLIAAGYWDSKYYYESL